LALIIYLFKCIIYIAKRYIFFVYINLKWFNIVEYFTTKFFNSFSSIFFIHLFLTQFYSIYNNDDDDDNNNNTNNNNNNNNNNEKATCNG